MILRQNKYLANESTKDVEVNSQSNSTPSRRLSLCDSLINGIIPSRAAVANKTHAHPICPSAKL